MDIFIRVLNPIIMIILGLAAGVIVSRQGNAKWNLYGIGALTFVGSQILHIPFNAWVLNPALEELPGTLPLRGGNLIIVALGLGLSAGVFEEVSRYVVFRFGIKDARSWKDALMFGAGHGGIEAILLGGLTLFSVMQIISLTEQDLSSIIPGEQLTLAEAQITAFWALPWYGVLLGARERLIALIFHVSASVLVLQVFQRNNIAWLFAAIFLHTSINAIAVYGSQTWGIFLTEGALALFSLLCFGIIFVFRTKNPIIKMSRPKLYRFQNSNL
ncbi:MAG: YhfC family intramembrane metalloprotease [Anaerolineae bacterium]|nr:YhfC family intramembrane metalloprotease [Anaerolineae bacterium]